MDQQLEARPDSERVSTPGYPPSRVRCREIEEADLDSVADVLTRGFSPVRDRAFWVRALGRLAERAAPAAFPRFGYLLESEGAPVGVLLLIFCDVGGGGERERIRCNVSSWCVDPGFRAFGSLLVTRALRHPHVTYFNITPAPHTFRLLEAQGYKRYCTGVFVAAPILSRPLSGSVVSSFRPGNASRHHLPAHEVALLETHDRYGCLSLVCKTADASIPFVFALRARLGVVRTAVLVYCRSIGGLVEVAGAVGRFLATRGIFFIIMHADGPVPGLVGRFLDGRPKYFKGASPPALGDLAYTEIPLLGV